MSEINTTTVSDRMIATFTQGVFEITNVQRSDSARMAESLSKTITKTLSDSIDVTDDSNGVLAGDDIGVTFIKVVADSANTEDGDPALSVGSTASDSGSISEEISLGLTKVLSDSMSAADGVLDYAFVENYTDGGSVTEEIAFAVGKGLADSPSIDESIALTVGKPLEDEGVMQEDVAKTLSKPVQETISGISDDETIQFTKVLTEAPAVSESLVKAVGVSKADDASVTESVVLAVASAYSDNSTVTESAVMSVAKSLSDSQSATDAGSLRSQGYCDFDYFSEDYVGESRIFT